MDRIVFLGTAGARFTVFRQIRASGGFWIILNDTQVIVDPGPGALVRCLKSKAQLDPKELDGIILSHRHLDHSADVNVMVEAMTQGGFHPRGTLFAPKSALNDDPVVLKYLRGFVEKVEVLRKGGLYRLKNIKIETPINHIHHNTETYGINFIGKAHTISFVADTRYFDTLAKYYKGDILILNVVRLKPSNLDHLCVDDAKEIIKVTKPKLAILTHFGMTMIRAQPWELAPKLSQELGTQVIAASDGMKIDL